MQHLKKWSPDDECFVTVATPSNPFENAGCVVVMVGVDVIYIAEDDDVIAALDFIHDACFGDS